MPCLCLRNRRRAKIECSPYQTGYRWRQDCRTLHTPRFFEFTLHFKIFILGKHKSSLTDVIENERRRLHIIQLEFVPDKPDHDLANTLKGKAGGILEWMIEGACLWSEQGLEKPQIVPEATNKNFVEQVLFREWLEEDCRYEPNKNT